jgi:hypothetical protein
MALVLQCVVTIGRRGLFVNSLGDAGKIRMVPVLSISGRAEVHRALKQIFEEFSGTLYPNCRPSLIPCSQAAGAVALVRDERIPIVLYDANDLPAGWQQVAREMGDLPQAPCLVLASADESLRTSKCGVYAVIAMPFSNSEVLRIINLAWRHWQDRHGTAAAEPDTRMVSGITRSTEE